ncbi:MAG: TnsA-like heteromeric transposase endonuclease subunit [Actinobacteria bacterium]|nr:TnsA-like heteromeric transposase endonuclease subunit [Actinomycetota bacterium]
MFRFSPTGPAQTWDWHVQKVPPVHLLLPVRDTRGSRHARHIPVTAFSMTNGDHVWLESGLEHDLLRKCDRDPNIRWIVPQPFRLYWVDPVPGKHTPDLLGLGVDGHVSVWDARRPAQQNDDFRMRAEITRRCCDAVDWHYEVFSGLSTVERLNLLWLHGFRRPPPWLHRHTAQIYEAAVGSQVSLGALFDLDDGSGELKSAVWHLVWRGLLDTDLTVRITEHTRIRVNEELWDV